MAFNILYTGGNNYDKACFLYKLCESPDSQVVHNNSKQLLSALETLVYVPTISVGEILNETRPFSSVRDESDFEELLALYSNNSNMIKEFVIYLINSYLFPTLEGA